MASRGRPIRVAFLNVVATPHPKGVYERLFRYVANRQVRFWGAEMAAIGPIRARPEQPGFFTGHVRTWVDIDPRSPAVQKKDLEEVALTPEQLKMSSELGFNGKTFRFILDTNEHRVSIATINDVGHKLAPTRALAIFERLFSPEVLGKDAEEVAVSIVPSDDALKRVLSIKRLDRVEIQIKRPNADDVTAETHEVLAELRAQNAKRQEVILIRAAHADSLELSDTNEKYARVAASGDGYVKSQGRNAAGEPEKRSTKEYPKMVERLVEEGQTFLGALAEIARAARTSRAQR